VGFLGGRRAHRAGGGGTPKAVRDVTEMEDAGTCIVVVWTPKLFERRFAGRGGDAAARRACAVGGRYPGDTHLRLAAGNRLEAFAPCGGGGESLGHSGGGARGGAGGGGGALL